MLKKIGIAAVVFLAVLIVVVVTRPGEFKISRSRNMAAAPDVVHSYVNDFHKWNEWSPWEKLDPSMKKEFSGAATGQGAVYSWAGNDKVGEGRMTITDTRPPQNVTIRLEFLKPWTATNMTQFDFAPNGTGTNVTWTMSGQNNFMAKAFSLVMDMEKMIGPDFERGLESLDKATASVAKPTAATPAP
jgi:hypothetical protein